MAVIVFDNDDTLMMNEWQYSEARAKFFAYLYRIFKDYTPNLHSLTDRFDEIEKEHFARWGIRRGRTTESKLVLYEEVSTYAQQRGLVFSKKVRARHLRHIAALGDLPFDYSRMQWRPGTERVLGMLKNEGHVLCLLTSYDSDVFPKKAAFLNIGRFFDPAHVRVIHGKKTPADFIAVSGWSEEREKQLRWFAVGNGESDIRPALDISERWMGIYVPHGSTSPLFEKGGANEWPHPVGRFMPTRFVHERVTTVMELDSRRAFEAVRMIVQTKHPPS